jgi:hypothetical protein
VDFLGDGCYYDEAECIQTGFLKRILGLRKSVCNDVILNEFARLPLKFHWIILIIRFFNRFVSLGDDRLVKQAFLESIGMDRMGLDCWIRKIRLCVKDHLDSFPDWVDGAHPIEEINEIELYDEACARYYSGIDKNRSKVQTYENCFCICPIGQDPCLKPALYLSNIESDETRNVVARFRTSGHNLAVELGRRTKIPRELRVCQCCNLGLVEDEAHVVFDCPLYFQIRGRFYKELFERNTITRNLQDMFSRESVAYMGQYLRMCDDLRKQFMLNTR